MYSIFNGDTALNLFDRRDLVYWLGRACALKAPDKNPPDNRGRAMDEIGGLLMCRWAHEAWKSAPELAQPDWAKELICCAMMGQRLTPRMENYSWSNEIARANPMIDIPVVNAQTDLMVFLQGYSHEVAQGTPQRDDFPGFKAQAVVYGCVALRILYGTEEKDRRPTIMGASNLL